MIIDIFADRHAKPKYDKDLIEEIHLTYREIQRATDYFNEQTDPNEIESVIYRLKQLESHFSYLIKQAKLEKICDIPQKTGGVLWR